MAEATLERTVDPMRVVRTVRRVASTAFTFILPQTCVLVTRCKNQIFFTWNKTSDELHAILDTIRHQTKNVQLDVAVGTTAHFLSAYIENQQGKLYSRVYQDPTTQKCTLPYVLDHASAAHSHWLRSALVRAARYCTSVNDFDRERLFLEITCLSNGYPIEFVAKRMDHFFKQFDASSLRLVLNQQAYEKLRRRLFSFINEQQHLSDVNHELEKQHLLVRLSYPYQFAPQHTFNEKCRDILRDALKASMKSPASKLSILFTNKNQHSLNAWLSGQKPSHRLLNASKPMN